MRKIINLENSTKNPNYEVLSCLFLIKHDILSSKSFHPLYNLFSETNNQVIETNLSSIIIQISKLDKKFPRRTRRGKRFRVRLLINELASSVLEARGEYIDDDQAIILAMLEFTTNINNLLLK